MEVNVLQITKDLIPFPEKCTRKYEAKINIFILMFDIWMAQCLINKLHEGIASLYLVALSADFIELCVHKTRFF